ncbi:MAG: TIGR03067 domain-containing protein [Gemmataceae bacterium]
MKCYFVVAFASLLALATIVRSDEGKKDAERLEGTWIPESAELAGKKFPDETRKAMKLVLKGDAYTVTIGTNSDKGKIKFDPSQNPKTMDIIGREGPNKDKTFLAIYELTKDTLTICYDLSGKTRPTEFKTKPDTKLFLVTYKREKS